MRIFFALLVAVAANESVLNQIRSCTNLESKITLSCLDKIQKVQKDFSISDTELESLVQEFEEDFRDSVLKMLKKKIPTNKMEAKVPEDPNYAKKVRLLWTFTQSCDYSTFETAKNLSDLMKKNKEFAKCFRIDNCLVFSISKNMPSSNHFCDEIGCAKNVFEFKDLSFTKSSIYSKFKCVDHLIKTDKVGVCFLKTSKYYLIQEAFKFQSVLDYFVSNVKANTHFPREAVINFGLNCEKLPEGLVLHHGLDGRRVSNCDSVRNPVFVLYQNTKITKEVAKLLKQERFASAAVQENIQIRKLEHDEIALLKSEEINNLQFYDSNGNSITQLDSSKGIFIMSDGMLTTKEAISIEDPELINVLISRRSFTYFDIEPENVPEGTIKLHQNIYMNEKGNHILALMNKEQVDQVLGSQNFVTYIKNNGYVFVEQNYLKNKYFPSLSSFKFNSKYEIVVSKALHEKISNSFLNNLPEAAKSIAKTSIGFDYIAKTCKVPDKFESIRIETHKLDCEEIFEKHNFECTRDGNNLIIKGL